MRKILLSVTAILWVTFSYAQTKPLTDLTVEEIMQDQAKFVGTSPSNISWSKDSKNIFFTWRNKDEESSSTFKVSKSGGSISKDDDRSEGWPSRYVYNKSKSKIIYAKGGDIYMMEVKNKKETQITGTNARESNPNFHSDDVITFVSDNNLFSINLKTGLMKQLTNFSIESNNDSNPRPRFTGNNSSGNKEQDAWLRDDQIETSSILKDQRTRPRNRNRFRGASFSNQVQASGDRRSRVKLKNIQNIQLSPDGNYVTFSVFHVAKKPAKNTIVPNYVTQSGYTTDIRARSKVGGEQSYSELGIYNVSGDSLYMLDSEQLPGITDLPDYVKDYPDREFEKKPRKVSASRQVVWSEDGKYAVVSFSAHDHKDRWIMRLLPESGELETVDRQRDEAWIGRLGGQVLGFLPKSETLYFQSEGSGYAHLYLYDFKTGSKKQITEGNYEVYSPFISNDGSKWYFTANKKHPGIKHFYSMPIKGGKITQITSVDGDNSVTLSPDEKTLAIRHSYIDKPYELFVQPNKAGADRVQITESQQDGFKQYDWHEAEIVTFKAEDGANVHARLYKPKNPNGAGVIFVHGAGYLQNVHYWWSSYQREYMFNNMLMAQGYTVLDIDYRASAGYGRDWRTGIYRHMGGKDLSDQIDGAKYLMKEHNVEAGRIGMYGGSYGGFITLFAMFQHPDIINSGAALRSVTDWAHYNHGYTSNILNTPVEDPIAYKRSSPIYFAEGLEGNLLIAHGMVDTNVHFQDVVRLAQKLIELGKDNWEMALYPVENHGFTTPSSWTDEYKRIYKLFETTIGQK